MKNSKKRTVLVTGNKGYIGSVLTSHLLKNGFNVVGLDTDYYEGCDFYKVSAKIPQIKKDVRNVSKNDLKNIDAIIHLAALSNDPLSEFDPTLTYVINHQATIRLAKLAKEVGVKRFVFSSSQSMYGISKQNEVYENSTLNPITAYGKTKIMAEQDLSKISDKNFTVVFLRPSTVYGPSPRMRLDIVLNNLVAWAFTQGKIKIMSDGSPWRPVVHIDDLSLAFIAAVNAPRRLVNNQAFNVGEKKNYRVKDMADLIQKHISCSVVYNKNFNPDERSYYVNTDKIHKVLKNYYFPRWNIDKGIRQLIREYKKNNLTYRQFTGHKFIRLNHLKRQLETNKIDKHLYVVNESN